ncbi:MAG: hypothetical protein K2Y01_00335 [Rhabdochlamydiaceae bacterium]|nr:hypothetical protein [Rhabdochlamydiaceae bacterium]
MITQVNNSELYEQIQTACPTASEPAITPYIQAVNTAFKHAKKELEEVLTIFDEAPKAQKSANGGVTWSHCPNRPSLEYLKNLLQNYTQEQTQATETTANEETITLAKTTAKPSILPTFFHKAFEVLSKKEVVASLVIGSIAMACIIAYRRRSSKPSTGIPRKVAVITVYPAVVYRKKMGPIQTASIFARQTQRLKTFFLR